MKGILFKPDMIKAIVEGRKTVTRRLDGLKEVNNGFADWYYQKQFSAPTSFYFVSNIGERIIKPRYLPGETVYIKEAWSTYGYPEKPFFRDELNDISVVAWHSPMFLPEKFARYFIKIKDVSPERLQEITEEDALLEGITERSYIDTDGVCRQYDKGYFVCSYQPLWDSINKKTLWASNPWVWRIEFERV